VIVGLDHGRLDDAICVEHDGVDSRQMLEHHQHAPDQQGLSNVRGGEDTPPIGKICTKKKK
jgi:hypothetical protein